MATISIPKELTPITINKFLGLNSAEESETQLELGEASEMLNMRITDDYKLQTIEGYKSVIKNKDITNLYVGKIKDETFLIYRYDKKLYKFKDNESTLISGDYEIEDCSYINFEEKLYILDGKEYYSYDNTTFKIVEGYVPLVAIGTEPTGGGTDFEGINLLTKKRHQTFSADGTAIAFILREKDLESIDKILVNGAITSATKDITNGKVTFSTAPAKGTDNIDVYWTVKTSDRDLITKNKYMTLYGGGTTKATNDTRIFIYGSEDNKNRYYYSDLGDSMMRGDYFPATNFKDEGASNFAITGLLKHYNRLVVFKENETRFAIYEDMQTTNTTGYTTYIPALASYSLNATVGNVAMNQVQLLDNYPVCINNKGLYLYLQTNVKAETNVKYISQRIQNELDNLDLTKAIMYDLETKHELWIAIDKTVYIYNYNIDVFSKLELAHIPKCFIEFNKELYFSCGKGLMKFHDDYTTFEDTIIEQKWESSYYNFGKDYKRKNVNRLYVSMKPFYNTNVDITFETDRGSSTQTFNQQQTLFNFIVMNFANFKFKYEFSIKPVRKKMKAKKFVFFKLKMFNEQPGTRFNIDSLSLKYTIGGETK